MRYQGGGQRFRLPPGVSREWRLLVSVGQVSDPILMGNVGEDQRP